MPRAFLIAVSILLALHVFAPAFAQDTIYLPIANSDNTPQAPTNTVTSTLTPLATPTSAIATTPTPTGTATTTSTSAATATFTATPTSTETPTMTPTATATPCGSLSGVLSVSTFLVSGCQYEVTGNVLVPEGTTLSVPSNVELQFDTDTYMIVDGTLKVAGTKSKPSIFTHSGASRWGGVKITVKSGNSSSFRNMIIEHVHDIPTAQLYSALSAFGASPALFNVTFRYNASPFHLSEGALLLGGEVLSNTLNGYLVGGTIDGVTFSGNTSNAVLLVCPGSSIQNSLFVNNSALPIYMGGCATTGGIHIQNNTFANNIGAIHITDSFSVTIGLNTIYNNGQALDNGVPTGAAVNIVCGTTLTGNNIYGNTAPYVVRSRPGDCDIDATSNWWGTTITSEVDSLIYDYFDDFTLGKIIYEPIRSAPLP